MDFHSTFAYFISPQYKPNIYAVAWLYFCKCCNVNIKEQRRSNVKENIACCCQHRAVIQLCRTNTSPWVVTVVVIQCRVFNGFYVAKAWVIIMKIAENGFNIYREYTMFSFWINYNSCMNHEDYKVKMIINPAYLLWNKVCMHWLNINHRITDLISTTMMFSKKLPNQNSRDSH